jgi:signal transduction histidine kinase
MLPFLLVALISAGVALPVTRRLVAARVEAEADRRLVETADSVGALIENSEKQALLSADVVANLPTVYASLEDDNLLAAALNFRKESLELQELSLYAPDFQPGDAPRFYGGPPVTRRFQTSEATTQIREALIMQVLETGISASGVAVAPQSAQVIGVSPVRGMGAEEGEIEAVILAAFFMDEGYIREIGSVIGTEVIIVRDNAIIATTISDESNLELLLNEGFLNPDTEVNATNFTSQNIPYRLLAKPLTIGNSPQGFVLAAQPIEVLSALNRNIQAILLLLSAVFVITSLGLGIFASYFFCRPVAALASATTNIRQGQLDQRVPVSFFVYKDEITELTENFNDMAARLKELYEGLEALVDQRTQELLEERQKLQETLDDLDVAHNEAVAANQAKSEFVSVVSHELKVPMTSIKGYSDLMLAGMAGELTEQQREFLLTVRNNVLRMATLVSDLNDISRIESVNLRIEPADVNLGEVISEVLTMTREQMDQKKQVLQMNIPHDLPMIWCDRNRVNQVLLNLVSNANKYTPEGGKIAINAWACEIYKNGQNSHYVQVAIKDNGYGISIEEQQKLFQKFFRSDDDRARRTPGTGLGLSITKNLIELQQGKIWFESALNEGTTFFFMLPVSPIKAG